MDRRATGSQRVSPVERAGWTGLAIGLVIGAMSVMLLVRFI